MLTKCIGIISYFPDKEDTRIERTTRFINLLSTLDQYFKLPIVIIAQNWKDFSLPEYSNTIYLYKYSRGLGITKARTILRDKLLNKDFDYFIFLDDDSKIICNSNGIKNYFNEIDVHPKMVGKFNGYWLRLLAISREMLKLMDFDFIENKEASRGEIWEDVAYLATYQRLYPQRFFNFSKKDIDEISEVSRSDPHSTWYKKEFGNEIQIRLLTRKIINDWVSLKRRN